MLQELLAIYREANGEPLSREAVAARLRVAPGLVEHMVRTLVQRGRLVEVEPACDGCTSCPLARFCGSGAPAADTRPVAFAIRGEP
ncbi:MAG: FeoC-like transcriptional regulator [Candidatus Promineifilaceae bacterium]|nr:FeoC-like transcriptional regulator [Candidatus Promineifilaceae bacterium]